MAPRNREDSGYLTSIVRIGMVPLAAAIAIVNTILNSIENLSLAPERRVAGRRRDVQGRGGGAEGVRI